MYWTRTNGDHALQPCVLPTELTKRRIQAQSLYPVTAKPLSNLTATSRRVGVEPTWQYAVFPLKRTPYRVIETIVFLPDLRTNCAGGSRTRIGLRLALAVKLPHSQVHTHTHKYQKGIRRSPANLRRYDRKGVEPLSAPLAHSRKLLSSETLVERAGLEPATVRL